MIWAAFVIVLLAGFAVGWVLGIGYGVQQEQRAQEDRARVLRAALEHSARNVRRLHG